MNRIKPTCARRRSRRHGHLPRGLSLLFALMSLAAISLAAVALVRAVDSGSMVIGNLGFKQDTTSAADRAVNQARNWLMTSGANFNADNPAMGYYATSQDGLDPTGRLTSANNLMAVVNWGDSDSCACFTASTPTCSSCSRTPAPAISLNGGAVTARYLITRMCPSPGAVAAANACAQPAANGLSLAQNRGEVRVGAEARPSAAVQVPYYRIIVRAVGGRNTVSFTESVVY